MTFTLADGSGQFQGARRSPAEATEATVRVGRGTGSQGCLYSPRPHHYPNQFVAPSPLPSKPVRQLCSRGRWVAEAPAILVATGFPQNALGGSGDDQRTVANTGFGWAPSQRSPVESGLSRPGQQESAPGSAAMPVCCPPPHTHPPAPVSISIQREVAKKSFSPSL